MNDMPLGGLHEQEANYAIADWLQTRGEWEASGERVGVIQGTQQRPDIILTQRGRMPVIVENEYGKPAAGDAKSRLGRALTSDNERFTEVIALGTDESVKRSTRAVAYRDAGRQCGDIHGSVRFGNEPVGRASLAERPAVRDAGGFGRLLRIRPSAAVGNRRQKRRRRRQGEGVGDKTA